MKNEELQQLVLESLGACSWFYDLQQGTVVYSNEYLALVGYEPNERVIDPDWVIDNIHPKDISQWQDSFASCIKGDSASFDCELRFKHKDDHYIWIQTHGRVIKRDSSGRALQAVGVVFDISERRVSKLSESRYRLFLDNIPDAITLKNRDGRYIYVNREFESWLRKPSFRICGKTAEQIFSKDNNFDKLKQHEEAVWQQGKTVSMERRFLRTADGKSRDAIITKYPIYDEAGQMLAIGSTSTDITERAEAQKSMRRSEQRYRRLFESAPVVLAEADWSKGKKIIDDLRAQGITDLKQQLIDHPELFSKRGDIMDLLKLNQEALRVYKTDSLETLIDFFLQRDLYQDQRLSLIDDLIAFASGQRRSIVRTRALREDGGEFPLLRESELYGVDADDWSQVLIAARDTSAEEAVRLSEERYRRLFESAPVSLAECDMSKGKKLIDDLHRRGIVDLRQHLIDTPELFRRRSDIMDVLAINQEALAIFRADSVAALKQHLDAELSAEQRLPLIDDLVTFASGKRRSTSRTWARRISGEIFPVIRESDINNPDREDWSQVLVLTRDISAEESIRESEARFRRLFDSAPIILCESDWSNGKALVDELRRQGVEDIKQHLYDYPELLVKQEQVMKVSNVNREALQVYRATSEQELIDYIESELSPSQRVALIDELDDFARGRRRSTVSCRNFRLDGEEFPVSRLSENFSADADDWSQVLLIVRDTSAEESVRVSEVRYRRLFETAPIAFYDADWSRGKALIERLRERGVTHIGNYLRSHPEIMRRRDDVLEIIDCNSEALRVYKASSKQQLIAEVEGEMNEMQRDTLITVIECFASGKRRSSMRSTSQRINGEQFPSIRESELVSLDRDDWSRVLSSIHDLTAEVENTNRLRSYQQELRSLAGQISLAEESERRRISSELHDGTIQNLVLARIHIASLKISLETEASRQLVGSIDELLEDSLKETRSLIFEISPPVLYELGLEPAVEWLVEHYRQRTGVSVSIVSDDGALQLSEEMNIVLFQVTRELLVNVAKHAQANSVAIEWQYQTDKLCLSVSDDGIGFDVGGSQEKRATEGGFGLFAVRERLKLLGADFDIQSSAQGTRVTITAPALQ